MNPLAAIAEEVRTNERTLRRAITQGTVRATRPTPRTIEISIGERRYIRRTWPLIGELREALRTEQNVRLALLFGSVASGEYDADSDIDIVVVMRDDSLDRLIDLRLKLEKAVDRPVDLTRLADAEVSPTFFSAVIEQARVLVDRENLWASLQAIGPSAHTRGARELERKRTAAFSAIDDLLRRRR